MSISTWNQLKSVPLTEANLVTGPSIQGEMSREFWSVADAYRQGSDQSVNIRPFSRARSILDVFSIAAELQGDSAKSSIMAARNRPKVHPLGSGDDQASSGCPKERMKKVIETARVPSDVREFMDVGRRLSITRHPDVSSSVGVFSGTSA